MTQTRKLAAVMFTDIVGYTAMMSKDEERTIETLQKNRRLHESLVPKYRGELLNEIGDGTLCCFQSALDAVLCAIAIQEHAEGEPDLSLHIGIHLGDVVFSEGTVYGDGVNVASRIESVTEPGGVYVSEQVYLQIKNHPEITAKFIGQKEFKNVDRPVDVYAVSAGVSQPEPSAPYEAVRKSPGRRWIWMGVGATCGLLVVLFLVWRPWSRGGGAEAGGSSPDGRVSIAVLPFDDYSDHTGKEHLADGMTDLLIADLAKVQRLLVFARTSSEYMGVSGRPPVEVARELDVAYLVVGSLFLVGDSVRITAQLIDTETEKHVWSDTYRGDLASILSMQSRAATAIAEEIEITLTPDDQRRLSDIQKVIPEAYDLHLEARSLFRRGAWVEAADRLERSLEIDPNFAPALALQATVHVMLAGFAGVKSSIPVARTAYRKAIALDPELPLGHVAAGMFHLDIEWNWQEAEEAYLKAIALSPNYPGAHEAYGHLLYCLARYDEAEREGLLARASDPLSTSVNDFLSSLAFNRGHYEETIAYSRRSLELSPNGPHAIFQLGQAYRALGQEDSARAAFERSLSLESQYTLLAFQMLGRWEELPQAVIDGVSTTSPFVVATVYAERGENDRVIELIRATMDISPAWVVYLRPEFERYPGLWSDPRMQEIVREVGLE